jgi:hypothetical protein
MSYLDSQGLCDRPLVVCGLSSCYIIDQRPPVSGHTKPLWPGITTFRRVYRV